MNRVITAIHAKTASRTASVARAPSAVLQGTCACGGRRAATATEALDGGAASHHAFSRVRIHAEDYGVGVGLRSQTTPVVARQVAPDAGVANAPDAATTNTAQLEEQREEVDQIERLIKKDPEFKPIDPKKFTTPLRDRVVFYSDENAFRQARADFARREAKRKVAAMSDAEVQKWIAAHALPEGVTLPVAGRDRIEWELGSKYIIEMLAGEVAGFVDPGDGKLHVLGSRVGLIAHEAFHGYSNPRFGEVLGHGLEEGMTEYLAEQIEGSYQSRVKNIPFVIPSDEYARYLRQIRELIESKYWSEADAVKAYFTGDPKLLQKLKRAADAAAAAEKKAP